MTTPGDPVPVQDARAAGPRLLLVEDDVNLGLVLHDVLAGRGFAVTLCRTAEEAMAAFEKGRQDLCLVDVVLPQQDGFELARQVRAAGGQVPIVFLTARSLPEDRIRGLTLGADDYVTKPFNLEELVLRLRAILRRTGRPSDSSDGTTRIGSYVFSPRERRLSRGANIRTLTYKESELLRLLCLRQNNVLDRSTALVEIWGTDSIFTARSMDVFVSRLRKYLRDDARIEILNVHGIGFSLVVHPDAQP